ncbi:MAG: glycosyltransferase family 39 protein [Acidimicrobiales bacterium]
MTRPVPVPAEVVTSPPGQAVDAAPAVSLAEPAPAYSRARATWSRVAGWRYFDVAFVTVFMALAVALRWRTLWTSYWGDEAIAIGIAAHPIGSLPRYLVQDGSPPLYYVGLHYWLALFGRSDLATHTLSMLPAVFAVPAAWWSGSRLCGRSAGRGAAALVATCSYLDYYSTETRMYSWVVLAAIGAVTFYVLAYREGGWWRWAGAAVLMAAALYLQYYGLYLLAGTVLAGSAAAVYRRSWARLRATAVYGLACAAAFAPWAPQFVYQLENTGAPWAARPSVLDFFGDTFNAMASAGWAGVVVAIVVAVLGRRRGPAARLGVASGPAAVSSLALVTAVPLATLVLAWAAGQFISSWNPRYLGVAGVPALVALAGGLARARRGALALALAVATLVATGVPMLVDRGLTVRTAKSDVAYLVGQLRPQLRPGALVISSEVTDMPVVAIYLGKGYRYATPLGLLRDPLVVDWSDLTARLHRRNAGSALAPLLATVPEGGQVLLVNPTAWGGPSTPERYRAPVEAMGVAANRAVLEDPQLVAEVTEGVPKYSHPLYPMTATLFVKVGPKT